MGNVATTIQNDNVKSHWVFFGRIHWLQRLNYRDVGTEPELRKIRGSLQHSGWSSDSPATVRLMPQEFLQECLSERKAKLEELEKSQNPTDGKLLIAHRELWVKDSQIVVPDLLGVTGHQRGGQ